LAARNGSRSSTPRQGSWRLLAWQLASAFAIDKTKRWPFLFCATIISSSSSSGSSWHHQEALPSAPRKLLQGSAWPLEIGASLSGETATPPTAQQPNFITIEQSSRNSLSTDVDVIMDSEPAQQQQQQQQQQKQLALICSAGLASYWPPFFQTTSSPWASLELSCACHFFQC
jgi:hypothetical protein